MFLTRNFHQYHACLYPKNEKKTATANDNNSTKSHLILSAFPWKTTPAPPPAFVSLLVVPFDDTTGDGVLPPPAPTPKPAVISPPKSALLLLLVASGMVFEPSTSSPAVFNDTSVPLIVVPGDPGFNVVPAKARAVGKAVMGWSPMVVMKGLG